MTKLDKPERRRRVKRKGDNIERDVVNAMTPGYGVHYGNYKADYPNTRDLEPEIIVEAKPCLYFGNQLP